MKTNIDTEVQKTLEVMQHRESVASNPYLYTRITAKLEGEADQKQPKFAWRWALSICLLLLNAYAIWNQQSQNMVSDYDLVEAVSFSYGFEEPFETTYIFE